MEETEPTRKKQRGVQLTAWMPEGYGRWVLDERAAALAAGFDCGTSQFMRYLVDLGREHYNRSEFLRDHGVAEEEE